MEIKPSVSVNKPATEYIFVLSIFSVIVMSGKIVTKRFANIDFPAPGGPVINKLCEPLAATSIALFTNNCPLTSDISKGNTGLSTFLSP